MKTVKIYMVRKPWDIDEVIELCRCYNNQAEEVTVAETVNLPPVWYDAICRAPLDDYIFLSGKGGYDDENHRQVVALQCPDKPTLYVDPSGSSYCRYMGIELWKCVNTRILNRATGQTLWWFIITPAAL